MTIIHPLQRKGYKSNPVITEVYLFWTAPTRFSLECYKVGFKNKREN